jgi:cytidylate kinase
MIVTVSGALGVGETAFVAALAQRLGLPVLGREEIRAALGQHTLTPPRDEADEVVPSESGLRAWFGGDRRLGEALAAKLLALLADRSAIVVGWGGADVLRTYPGVLHLRLTAEREARLKRLRERTDSGHDTAESLLDDSDAHRAEFHHRLFGADWSDPRRYHAVLNLSRLEMSAAVELAACFATAIDATMAAKAPAAGPWRWVTVSRQFGAGGAELAELLAAHLGWPAYDRQLLHQSGELNGIGAPELVLLDEHGPEFLERLHLLQGAAHYFAGLRAAIDAAVAQGPAILVGRGANFLVAEPAALHVRLVADDGERLERVMRRRWLAASAATALLQEGDRARAAFHRHFFHADWAEPTLYHVTCCSSRLPLPAMAQALAGFVGSAGEVKA